MNKKQPTQLRQRVDYLRQKIEYLYQQVKYSGDFQLKMKFLEFIDYSIDRVNQLEDKKHYSSETVNKKYQEHSKAQENTTENKRLEREKQELEERQRELDQRERQMEINALRLELQNCRVQLERNQKAGSVREGKLEIKIADLEEKIKAQEREIQKIGKMNFMQNKEIQKLKEERNRAEKKELELRQKYQSDPEGQPKAKDKKPKYNFHNEQGLRMLKTITNITTQKKGNERFILCDLPLKFHVIKIVFGIKVGMIANGEQVEYFDEVSLYEKEDMQMFYEGGELVLLYVKRKVKLKLKYGSQKNQVVLMLFGRGDSVGIDSIQ